MIRRVSPTRMMQSAAPAQRQQNSFPKLQDILVDLSVKNTPKVIRKLKLIGDPYMFIEYTDKQYVPNPTNDPSLRGKTVAVPFPDAHLNKKFNRIGHDDPSQCPWKKMGYVGVTQYAQNVLEMQEDGSWEVKILKKGKSIFNKIAQDIAENYQDATNDDGDGRHYGTRNAQCVRITATATGKQPPLSVEYTVAYDKKATYIDDDMIELLRKAGEPNPEELAKERKTYEYDAQDDPYMPVWEDFFAYGYPLNKIFKFDAIRSEDDTATVSVPAKSSFKDTDIEPNGDFKLSKTSKIQEDDEDDDEPVVAKKSPRAKVEDEDDDEGFTVKPPVKAAPKRVPVSLSDDDDDDEEDGSTMGWIGK